MLKNKSFTIGFAGNPNCGKTTLFNAYTGANLKVANWPGVTVEKKEGTFKYNNDTYKLVDIPGVYSLTSYTIEERVSRKFIMSKDVDLIINVADASALERNLYLTLQLIETKKPVVLALNMMDIVQKRGIKIDMRRLSEMLGIPVIPVSAKKKNGLDALMHEVSCYSKQAKTSQTQRQNQNLYFSNDKRKLYGEHARSETEEKYRFIEQIIRESVINKGQREKLTDRLDTILTNRYLGMPIFLGIMALVFVFTFKAGGWLKVYFEMVLDWFSCWVSNLFISMNVNEILSSLVVDGIIKGVGGILTFLPSIFILFLALSFLEDSGYMSRVAYITDGIMGKMGLSGKAFIPMLLGFGCTVPAVMASRTLENRKDRIKTILIIPFMSCSAKLPVYVMFSQMFFGKMALLAAYSMYVAGIAIGILYAAAIRIVEGKRNVNSLLIELPEYKVPGLRTIMIYVWGKVKDYLVKAGTVIFIASIVMWALLNVGPDGITNMENSVGAILGKWIEPLFKPIGLGYWQIIVALISGIAAKELVLSSSSVLFGTGNVSGGEISAGMTAAITATGFGTLNAYALMIFCLLYTPCIAAVATMRKEIGNWRVTGFAIVVQILIAWAATFITYNVGKLL